MPCRLVRFGCGGKPTLGFALRSNAWNGVSPAAASSSKRHYLFDHSPIDFDCSGSRRAFLWLGPINSNIATQKRSSLSRFWMFCCSVSLSSVLSRLRYRSIFCSCLCKRTALSVIAGPTRAILFWNLSQTIIATLLDNLQGRYLKISLNRFRWKTTVARTGLRRLSRSVVSSATAIMTAIEASQALQG
jgi:hypothetical protein